MEWFLKVIKDFSFSGRARRKEYWMFTLVAIVILLALHIVDSFVGLYSEEMGIGVLSGIFSLAILVQSIAVAVRRLHDTNRSGWWILIGLIPLIGGIVLLVFMILKGTQGENRYGADPRQAA